MTSLGFNYAHVDQSTGLVLYRHGLLRFRLFTPKTENMGWKTESIATEIAISLVGTCQAPRDPSEGLGRFCADDFL